MATRQDSVGVHLLGQFRIMAYGQALRIPSDQARLVLAFLSLRPSVPVLRGEVAATLWPESDGATARARLRQILWKLRRLLHPVDHMLMLTTTASTLSLDCEHQIIDVLNFRRLVVAQGNDDGSLRAAVQLYHGDLLEEMTGEWLEQERYNLRALFLRAVRQLISLLLARNAAAEALPYAHRAVDLDPLDEESTYLFMQAAAGAGKPAVALAQYDSLVRLLRTDLNVAPAPHIVELFRRISAPVRPVLSSRVEPAPSLSDSGSPEDDLVRLTGRLAEHERLRSAVSRTREGHGTAVIITGPPGMGKTRLAEAVATEAQTLGVAVYRGRCSDITTPPPYQSIVEALWPQVESISTSDLSPVIRALFPGHTNLVGRRLRNITMTRVLDATLMTESLIRLLSSSGHTSSLLFVDDVHRADHATRAWLNSLLMRLSELRVCVVLTSRTGEIDEQEQYVAQLAACGAEIIPLQALDQAEVRSLVSTALGTTRPPRSLSRAIWTSAGGNPLQILEAIRLLKDRGLLHLTETGWILDPKAPEVLATLASAHVRGLVRERIALLSHGARDVLAAAAILGMALSPTHLHRVVAESVRTVFSQVRHLIRHRLLSTDPDGLIRFPHEEIRNTVLDQLSDARRRTFHARAAQILSRTTSARPEDLYWHYEGASNYTGAFTAAVTAGDRAFEVGEFVSSVEWYDRALMILSNTDTEPGSTERLSLELRLESALNEHGSRPRQLLVLRSVLEATRATGDDAMLCEALIRQSLCLTRMNDRDAAISSARLAIDCAQKRLDLHREARSHRAMGLAYENFDDSQNISYLRKALRLFRQLATKSEECMTLSELATAYDRIGNHTAALRALDRAAALVSEDDRSRGLLVARRAAATLWTGRLSETYAALDESLLLLRRYGDRIGEARTLRILSDAHCIAGRYREALGAAGRALQIARQANDTRLVSSILNSLIASIYGRLGLIHRARATFDRVIVLLGTDPRVWYRALCEDSLSMVYLHLGEWEKARAWAERALVTAAMLGREWYASTEARLHLGQALLELREPLAARQHLLISLRYHRATGDLPYQAFETALLARCALDLGDPHEAETYLRESTRLVRRIDVLQDPHLLHWLHGSIWGRLGANTHAARAFRVAYTELNRIATSLGTPLRRRFLALPFQRRVLEAVGMAPQTMPNNNNLMAVAGLLTAESLGIGSQHVRRQAVLRALSHPTVRPSRRTLAAAFGVTPRTITNDIAALRRDGYQIESPRTLH